VGRDLRDPVPPNEDGAGAANRTEPRGGMLAAQVLEKTPPQDTATFHEERLR